VVRSWHAKVLPRDFRIHSRRFRNVVDFGTTSKQIAVATLLLDYLYAPLEAHCLHPWSKCSIESLVTQILHNVEQGSSAVFRCSTSSTGSEDAEAFPDQTISLEQSEGFKSEQAKIRKNDEQYE
jgi:hypothetical protein